MTVNTHLRSIVRNYLRDAIQSLLEPPSELMTGTNQKRANPEQFTAQSAIPESNAPTTNVSDNWLDIDNRCYLYLRVDDETVFEFPIPAGSKIRVSSERNQLRFVSHPCRSPDDLLELEPE